KRTWDTIRHRADEYKRLEHKVYLLMKRFRGQKVPGYLFGIEGEVTLPKFHRIYKGHIPKEEIEADHRIFNLKKLYEFDIIAYPESLSENEDGRRWLVETKLRTPSSVVVEQVYAYSQNTYS